MELYHHQSKKATDKLDIDHSQSIQHGTLLFPTKSSKFTMIDSGSEWMVINKKDQEAICTMRTAEITYDDMVRHTNNSTPHHPLPQGSTFIQITKIPISIPIQMSWINGCSIRAVCVSKTEREQINLVYVKAHYDHNNDTVQTLTNMCTQRTRNWHPGPVRYR
jgi:hypothetical protein